MEQSKSCEELQIENDQLRQRLQEMEQAHSELQQHANTLQERAAWLEAIFERAAVGLVIGSMEGHVLNSNAVFQAILGYPEEELHGMSFEVFTHAEEVAHEMALLTEVLEGKRPSYQIDKRYIRKDGQVIWVRVGVSLLRDAAGNPSVLLASVEDINEQKRMQAQLEERDERMRLVLNATNDGVWDWYIPTGEVYFSNGWQTMIGYEPGELEGHVSTWEKLLHPDDTPHTIQTLDDHLQGKTPVYEVEFRMQTKSGGWKWILDRGKVVEYDAQGQPVRVLGTHVDISRQKETEQQLQEYQESLHIFKALADNSPDAIGIATLDGTITYANPSFRDMFGYGDATVGMMNVTLFSQETQEQIVPTLLESVMTKGFWVGMLAGLRKNGSTFPVQLSGFCIRDEHSNVLVMPAIIRDMTELHQKEQALRASEARHRSTYERAPMGIFRTCIEENRFIHANPALAQMFGYSSPQEFIEHVKVNQLYAVPEQRAEVISKLQETQQAVQFEIPCKRRDNHEIIVKLSVWRVPTGPGELTYLEGFIEDITERKKAEEERKMYQQQIIEAQQAALRELSAPLLPISENVIIMPLIGSIDTRRAQHIMETLLEGVAEYQADIAIVDITGIKVVDTQIADALIRAAQAVKLLGSQVVLTGIGPAMAQTLVHLGADLSSIVTRGSLQRGIAYAVQV